MRAYLPISLVVLFAGTATLAGPIAAQPGHGKLALGLKAPTSGPVWRAGEDATRLQLRGDATTYDGVRDMPRFGLSGSESYSGIFQPLADNWGSTFEAGVAHDAPFAMSRYSLTGQVYTTLAPRHGLSLGLKLSTVERSPLQASLGPDPAGAGEPLGERRGGSSYGVQFNYLYGTRHSVGLSYQLANTASASHYTPYGLAPNPRAFALSSEHWLSPNWSMTYDISAPEPGLLLQSPSLGMGLRYRF